MPHHDDLFASAVQTAHDWVRAIADGLDTDDTAFAYRALRAWMHTVRDRIGVANSAHLAAQLPELLRGTYYEGWVPSHVPVRHGTAEFVTQFAREAGIERSEVGFITGSITAVLSELFSPGQLDRVFAVLPTHLYGILCGTSPVTDRDVAEPAPVADAPDTDRFAGLEYRIRALSDAVAVLARGLEQLPVDESDSARTTSAAQQAHRILLAEGLVGAYAQER
ncbi:DUF2267 domain-containing protein [Nocardia sp. CS682]|uniref:DUF2267 domain-containing protein n=1 Tax=Nocardia sp. CS682 TaxID=1047172 RepID=UPI001074E979|nr:DUF2267 domain-containing protein [Nocardia sp. CS682]QBS45328.1 DUF2267 domain-containing protein [Nocardia sp. CS682]